MRSLAILIAMLFAMATSAGSLYFLVDYAEGLGNLVAFFCMQSLVSAALAVATLNVLPPQWREPRRPVLALLFCFSFFIPLFGAAGMLIAALIILLVPKNWRYRDFGEVQRIEYNPPVREAAAPLRISSLRPALLDPSAPVELRLRSLVAMQTLPLRTVGPLLRRLLSDPSDDLRLLAYGTLNKEEKRINAMISAEEGNLARSTVDATRVNSLRHLAELHWELIYTGLVQGDVRKHAAASAMRHLGDALAMVPQDAGLWMLMGRLRQARGDVAGSEQAFQIAVSCGLEETRALPYLAEIAYHKRQFMLVRDYLAALTRGPVTQAMSPVIRYWRPRRAA